MNLQKHESMQGSMRAQASQTTSNRTTSGERIFGMVVTKANHPIHAGAFPPDVVAGLLAFVPLVKLDFLLDTLPSAEEAGVANPLISGTIRDLPGGIRVHYSFLNRNYSIRDAIPVLIYVNTFINKLLSALGDRSRNSQLSILQCIIYQMPPWTYSA
jgi:hypothetical protein